VREHGHCGAGRSRCGRSWRHPGAQGMVGCKTALTLLGEGHRVVLHARSAERAASLGDFASRAAGIAVGDLQSAADTRSIADQVKRHRSHGCDHPQRWRLRAAKSRLVPRGAAGVLAINAGAVHADGTDRAPRSADLPQQRPASRRRRLPRRPRLDEAHLGSSDSGRISRPARLPILDSRSSSSRVSER
jgi:NAD(P)-dependent dehydrogenase (short-subunit alcohol dehydrogenase family)